MTTQPQKTTVRKKTTQKKRLLNKLPANLPAYNYEAFSYKDMQRAVSYFQTELAKIEKLLNKLPTITNQQEAKPAGNSPVANLYMDIYGSNQSNYNNQIRQQLAQQPAVAQQLPKPASASPEVVAAPLPYQPYQPGMKGDHMEMPSILGSSGEVVNTLKDKYDEQPFNGIQALKVETARLPVVEDNSAELEAELKGMLR